VATIPVDYVVDSVRDGKSYVTRMVKAIQRDRMVMVILCSFHKSEPWQPTYHWSIPDVPAPEQCKDDQDYFDRGSLGSDFSEKVYQAKLAVRFSIRHLQYMLSWNLRRANEIPYNLGLRSSITPMQVAIFITPTG